MDGIGLMGLAARDDVPTALESGSIAIGFVLQYGVESVEYLSLFTNVKKYDDVTLAARVSEGIEALNETLSLYGLVAVSPIHCVVDPDTTVGFMTYTDHLTVRDSVIELFRSDDLEKARDLAEVAVSALNAHGLPTSEKALLPSVLSDLENRLGFLRSICGDLDGAKEAFGRAIDIGGDAREWLQYANLGYLHAASGDWLSAVSSYRRALETLKVDVGETAWLQMAIPPAPEWSPPSPMWNVSQLDGFSEAEAFLRAEIALAQTLDGDADVTILVELLSEADSCPAVNRLAGWVHALLLGDGPRASECLAQARLQRPALEAAIADDAEYLAGRGIDGFSLPEADGRDPEHAATDDA
jgi:hypothetical protein